MTGEATPRKRPTGLLVAVGSALVILLGAAFAFSKNYEIIAEGQLLPFTDGKVARVRFFDAFTIWISREPIRLLDVANTVALAILAGIALLALAQTLRRPGMDRRVQAFFLVCVVGAMWLALDESMAVHETIGDNMQFLGDLPGVHRPDDLIFALYVVPAIIFLVVFHDLIRSSPAALRWFGAAILLVIGSAVFDVIGIGVDELLEPLSSVCIIGGFTAVALAQLEQPGRVTRAPH